MYGLCKGKPAPKMAEHKVQETIHFRYLKLYKLLVIRKPRGLGPPNRPPQPSLWETPLVTKNPHKFVPPI